MFQQNPVSGIRGLRTIGSQILTSGSLRSVPLGSRRRGGAITLSRQPAGGRILTGLTRRTPISGLSTGGQPIRAIRIPAFSRGTVRQVDTSRIFGQRTRTSSNLRGLLSRTYNDGRAPIITSTRSGFPVIRIPARRNAIASPIVGRRITQSRSTSRTASRVVSRARPSTTSRMVDRPRDDSSRQLEEQILALFAVDDHLKNETSIGGSNRMIDEIPGLSETISHGSKKEKIETSKTVTDAIAETQKTVDAAPPILSADTSVADADQVNISVNQTAEIAPSTHTETAHADIKTSSTVVESKSQVTKTDLIAPKVDQVTDAVVVPEPVIADQKVLETVIVDGPAVLSPVVESGAAIAQEVLPQVDVSPVDAKSQVVVEAAAVVPVDVTVPPVDVIIHGDVTGIVEYVTDKAPADTVVVH